MTRLADQLQRQFGIALLASFILGLLVPAVGELPAWLLPGLLLVILFLSCAQIAKTDLAAFSLRDVVGFCILRFVLVPAALYLLGTLLWPDAAVALMLLGLLPAGVTTAAVTAIVGGNVTLALGVTALSTMLAPLLIPLALLLVGQPGVDPAGVGTTLLVILVLPAVLYVGVVRHSERAVRAVRTVGPLLSVVLICVIALLVSNGEQARILAEPAALVGSGLVGGLVYAVFYLVGALWGRAQGGRERIGWTLSSGNNNIVLGLALAVLYLTPADVVRFVAWDLAWICGLSVIQLVLPLLTGMRPSAARTRSPV